MRLVSSLFLLLWAACCAAQDCLPLPPIDGPTCAACAPAGWTAIQTSDVAMSDGSHPIPGCSLGNVSGPSPGGGNVVFLVSTAAGYTEGITTVVSGLNTGQEYSFGLWWEMVSTQGCEIHSGGSLQIELDGTIYEFSDAQDWQLVELCFTPSSSSITVTITADNAPAGSILIDTPDCNDVTSCCLLTTSVPQDIYTLCPGESQFIEVNVQDQMGAVNAVWTSVPADGVTYLDDPNAISPTFSFPAGGAFPGAVYTFTVEITDDACSRQEEITVIVEPAIVPLFDFQVCKTSLQSHFPTVSDDGFTGTWSGNFNLIGLVGTVQDFVFTLDPGQANCLTEWTYSIPIELPAPAFFIDPPNDITVECFQLPIVPGSLSFTNGLSDGCNISGSVIGTETGSYDACGGLLQHVWIYTDDCNRTIFHSQNIEVMPAATPIFDNPPADVTIDCGEAFPDPQVLTYYNFEQGDCEIIGLAPPTIITVNPTTQEVIWQFTNPCSNSVIQHIQVVTFLAPTDFEIDPDMINLCLGESYDLNDLTIVDPSGENPTVTYHSASPATPANELPSNIITPSTNTTIYVLLETATGCSTELPLIVVVDTVANAGNNGSDNICFEQPDGIDLFALLNGSPDAGGTWSDLSSSGVDLSDPTNVSLIGLAAGTYEFQYSFAANGNCPSSAAIVTLELLSEITIDILPPTCAPDLNSYQVIINTNGYTITSNAGSISNTGADQVTISGIPIGNNVEITATDAQNVDCFVSTVVTAPVCSCGTVDEPISDGDEQICFGQNNPTLSVSLQADQIANWYDAPTGGTLLLANSTSYVPTPTAVGIYQYYVESQSTIDSCTSMVRTEINFEILELPIADMAELELCSTPGNAGFAQFDLTEADALVNSSATVNITYHISQVDAENQSNPIGPIFTNTVSDSQIIYASVVDVNGCSSIAAVTLTVSPLLNITLDIDHEVCIGDENGSVIINAPGATNYSLDGITFTGNNTFGDLSPGPYTAYVTANGGCDNQLDFTIDPGIILTIDDFDKNCNDNGTVNDPNDDFYIIEFTVFNDQSANGMYDVLDGGVPIGSGTYGQLNSFNFPALGQDLNLEIVDQSSGCTILLAAGLLPPCSSNCSLSIENIALVCEDNGTITNPADDFYVIDISTTVTGPGSSGQFEVFADGVSQGVFAYGTVANIMLPADGSSPIIMVQDVDIPACFDEQVIGPLDDCAQACILNASFDNIICDDNGTGNIDTDDTFTFEVIVTGQNTGTGWTSDHGTNGNYGTATIFGPYLISGGNQLINITDDVTGNCTTTITVSPPNPCSDNCQLSINNLTLVCDDNGTLTNPLDDFYSVDIAVTVSSPGPSNQYEVFADGVSLGVFNYGTSANVSVPADGSSPIIMVQDVDIPVCFDEQIIGPLDDCAQACIINASFDNIVCDDNGTGNINSDDTFTFEVIVTGQNTGAGWTSDHGTNGNYGTSTIFGPYLISDGTQLINITDDVTGTCTTTISVNPPNTCSDTCAININNIALVCNDNGTLRILLMIFILLTFPYQ